MTIEVQRETVDWVKKTHYQNGVTYTGSWSYQIVPFRSRPTGSWVNAVVNGSDKGIDVSGLSANYYWVFYRIDGVAPYIPVEDPEVLVVL